MPTANTSMSSGQAPELGTQFRSQMSYIISLTPTIIGAAVFVFLLIFFRTAFDFQNGPNVWNFAYLITFLVISAAISAGGYALMPPLARGSESIPVVRDPNVEVRSRIAPIVLAIGGVAILVLTLTLIVAFVWLANQKPDTGGENPLAGKVDTILMGIFGSVVPILATWVGTVIAFYFTNESYKQAALATRAAFGSTEADKPNVAEKMIPYEKITKREVEKRGEADSVRLADVLPLMKDSVTRVIIFDKTTRNPVYIIRKKLVPADWFAAPEDRTVKDYRDANGGSNANDSIRFNYVPVTSTTDHASQVMRDTNCADVFVTATGQKTEAFLGWLTDDLLKGA